MEAARQPWPALGVLLLRDGLVTTEMLESVLSDQDDTRQRRISGHKLGELLIERGVVTATQIARLVAEQYELPFIELDVSDIDLDAASHLDEDTQRRFLAVPLVRRADGSFLLAIADPSTALFSDELRAVLDAHPQFIVAGPEAIEMAIAFVRESLRATRRADEWSAREKLPEGDGGGGELPAEPADAPPTALEAFARRPVAQLWPPLGALLIREGLVTDADLDTALAQQRLLTSYRLGEILVERGIVTEAQVAQCVANQYELPFVELAEREIDLESARLLDEEVARMYPAIPIALAADGALEVAIGDPTNAFYSDGLRRALAKPLTFVVAAPREIEAALDAVHAPHLRALPDAPREAVHPSEPAQDVDVASDLPAEPEAVETAPTPSDRRAGLELETDVSHPDEETTLETVRKLEGTPREVEPAADEPAADEPEAALEAPAEIEATLPEETAPDEIEATLEPVSPPALHFLPEPVEAAPDAFEPTPEATDVAHESLSLREAGHGELELIEATPPAGPGPDEAEAVLEALPAPEPPSPPEVVEATAMTAEWLSSLELRTADSRPAEEPTLEARVEIEATLPGETAPDEIEATLEPVSPSALYFLPVETDSPPAVDSLLEPTEAAPDVFEPTPEATDVVRERFSLREAVEAAPKPSEWLASLELATAEPKPADELALAATAGVDAPADLDASTEVEAVVEATREIESAPEEVESTLEAVPTPSWRWLPEPVEVARVRPDEVTFGAPAAEIEPPGEGEATREALPTPPPRREVVEAPSGPAEALSSLELAPEDSDAAPETSETSAEIGTSAAVEAAAEVVSTPVPASPPEAVEAAPEPFEPAPESTDVADELPFEESLVGAESIHLSPSGAEVAVRVRREGRLATVGEVTDEEAAALVSRLQESGRFTTHVVPTVRGEITTLVARGEVDKPMTLDALGLPEHVDATLRAVLDEPPGLILICGPRGSGVSTTSLAILGALSAPDRLLATVEDPVRRLLDGVDQIEVHRAAGITAAQCVAALLRAHTDVILVDELRDRETSEAVVRAAIAGRRVLAGFRAPTALSALLRLADLGIDSHALATGVRLVLAQRLVRRVCTQCSETYYASSEELRWLGLDESVARLLIRGRGCDACDQTGYRGQAGVFEALPITSEIRELLLEGASTKKIRRAAATLGVRTLRDDAVGLCLEGITTAAEVERAIDLDD